MRISEDIQTTNFFHNGTDRGRR